MKQREENVFNCKLLVFFYDLLFKNVTSICKCSEVTQPFFSEMSIQRTNLSSFLVFKAFYLKKKTPYWSIPQENGGVCKQRRD